MGGSVVVEVYALLNHMKRQRLERTPHPRMFCGWYFRYVNQPRKSIEERRVHRDLWFGQPFLHILHKSISISEFKPRIFYDQETAIFCLFRSIRSITTEILYRSAVLCLQGSF